MTSTHAAPSPPRICRSRVLVSLAAWIAKPEIDVLGNITFEDGKVSSITKRWGEYSGRGATELANALLGALDSGRGTGMAATITVEPPIRTPEVTITSKDINFGIKAVSVLIGETRATNHTSISVDLTFLANRQ